MFGDSLQFCELINIITSLLKILIENLRFLSRSVYIKLRFEVLNNVL